MKIIYDKKVDILTIRFNNKKIAESDSEKPGIIIDFDEDENIVAIEVLNASKKEIAHLNAEFEIV